MAPKIKWFLVAAVLSLALDQGTKVWARQSLRPRAPEVVTVIPGYFELEYAENTGSAFSFLRGRPWARWAFLLVGLVALGVVGHYLKQTPDGARRIGAELGLLAGGALGNMIDRAIYGPVTDFILWRAGAHRWPNFNIADAALVVGIIGLLIDWKPPKGAGKAPEAKTKARA